MKNSFDSRNRDVGEIIADMHKSPVKYLSVLGSHDVDAAVLANMFRTQWDEFIPNLGFTPSRLVTSCADRGVELAVRLAARSVTQQLAVIFHRPTFCGAKKAEEIRDQLMARETDALLIITTGRKVCTHARARFAIEKKNVYEVEVS